MTFKSELYDICSEVASEFPDWNFSSGAFKNKTLKHSTMVIGLGLFFRNGNTPLHPSIVVQHKKSMALFKKLNGYDQRTSTVLLQSISQCLEHTPEALRLGAWIFEDKNWQMAVTPPSELARKRIIDITEARSVLRGTMMDGIVLMGKLYDFSSEENFLRNLPPKYSTRADTIPYDEFERQKGIMLCVVHMLIGDFDYVDRYSSDDYRTVFPKRPELGNIVAALPALKRAYAETGRII